MLKQLPPVKFFKSFSEVGRCYHAFQDLNAIAQFSVLVLQVEILVFRNIASFCKRIHFRAQFSIGLHKLLCEVYTFNHSVLQSLRVHASPVAVSIYYFLFYHSHYFCWLLGTERMLFFFSLRLRRVFRILSIWRKGQFCFFVRQQLNMFARLSKLFLEAGYFLSQFIYKPYFWINVLNGFVCDIRRLHCIV